MYPWRQGGVVVSALEFRSEDRWFDPGFYRRVVYLDNKFYFTLPLFTQGTGDHNAGG